MDALANLAITTVATAPSPASSGLSLIVKVGTGVVFPATPFQATIWPILNPATPSNAEIVRCTNVTSDTLTIVRAQEGTSARSILVGDRIAASVTLKWFTDLLALVGAFTVGSHAGSLALGNAVSSGTVTGLGLGFTPTKAFLQVRRPAGALSIQAYPNAGTIGSGGFNFELSAATDSTSYVLDYLLL